MSINRLKQYISNEEFTPEELPEGAGDEAVDGAADAALEPETTEALTEAEVAVPEVDAEVTDEAVEAADEEADEAEELAGDDAEALDEAALAADENEEAIASVEHFMAVLKHGIETKTYSPQFATTAQRELDKLNGLFGGKVKGTPSLESFNRDDMSEYYTASLESFRGFVKRLWDLDERIKSYIPDLLAKGNLVSGFKKRASALNKRLDSLSSASFTGSAEVSVPRSLGGRKDIVSAAQADLRLTTQVASKGLGANEKLIRSLAAVLVEATNDGGVGKTGAIVAKANSIPSAAASYPAEAFSSGFLGGKKLVAGDATGEGLKALQKGGIPGVGKGEKSASEKASFSAADVSKLISVAKAFAALADKAADATGVAALESLKSIKGKVNRAHGGGFVNSAGRSGGAQATSWAEGKDLDALATALPKILKNHVDVYRFINGHALEVAEGLATLAAKAISAGGKEPAAE